MGTTGLIYLAIAAAWLAYLIPHYLKKREDEAAEADVDPHERFSDSMRIIRTGTAPVLDHRLTAIADVEISTPATRRVATSAIAVGLKRAAKRRRRVLVVIMVAMTAVLAVCAAGLISWLYVAAPLGLLVGFVVVARLSVRVMEKDAARRYDRIQHGSDESTVLLTRAAVTKAVTGRGATRTPGVTAGGLWEPLPITLPTYLSKPLAPRTVRTIDLSAPDVTDAGRPSVPVTADPEVPVIEQPAAEERRPRAVGE